MTICDDGHEEICFDTRRCPLCDVIRERDALDKELSEVRSELLQDRAQD